MEINSKGWFLNQNLWEGRFNFERSSTKRATRVMSEPLINTITMKIVVTPWQHLHFLTVSKFTKADATLSFVPRAFVAIRGRVVEDYGQLLNRRWVKSLRRRVRRRLDGGSHGEASLVAANPARVDEENGDEDDNGEKHDHEEQGFASDLEVSVIDFCVVPVQ